MPRDKTKSGKTKDADKDAAREAVEAVRSAFERTLAATAGSAQETQKRAQGLLDEIAAAATRVRQAVEEVNLLDELRGLRGELETLARRVAALERRAPQPAQDAAAPATPSPTAAATKPAARRGAAKATKAAKAKRAAKAPKGARTGKPAAKTAGTATTTGAAKRAKRGAAKQAPATDTADDAGSGRS